MTEELPRGLVTEDSTKMFYAYRSSIGSMARLSHVKTEREYIDLYATSDIFRFQIVDIDLGRERLGYEFAADIARIREKQGKRLVPIILVSAYCNELERIKNDPHLSKYFNYFICKNTFLKVLRNIIKIPPRIFHHFDFSTQYR